MAVQVLAARRGRGNRMATVSGTCSQGCSYRRRCGGEDETHGRRRSIGSCRCGIKSREAGPFPSRPQRTKIFNRTGLTPLFMVYLFSRLPTWTCSQLSTYTLIIGYNVCISRRRGDSNFEIFWMFTILGFNELQSLSFISSSRFKFVVFFNLRTKYEGKFSHFNLLFSCK